MKPNTILCYLFGEDTLMFLKNLRENISVFFMRHKESNDSLPFKIARLGFFINFMVPSALFGVNPWFQRNCYFFVVFCLFTMGKSTIVALFFLFWLGLWVENIMLGLAYHNITLFKKQLDWFCLGSDMVLAFFGNTGTAFNKMTPAVFRGVATAVGAGAGEAIVTEGLAIGLAKANTMADPSLDFGTQLKYQRTQVQRLMPLNYWYNGGKTN